MSDSESVDPKKVKTVNWENQTAIPKMGESETFLFSAIQSLANNISVSFNMMNNRMNQLKTNLEEKISANIQTALKTHIETEVGKVKQELKEDINSMNRKIENVQKSYDNLVSEKKDEDSPADIRNNVIIKNLEYDEREKNDSNVTLHKVQELFRDGLTIPNIKIRKVSRKNGNERYNGVVVVQLDEIGQKKEIFKQKCHLKNKPAYRKVYIDNDLPVETRMFQGNVRTLLKEIGKENEMMFVGNKLVHKRH